jgi:hypothetical protein
MSDVGKSVHSEDEVREGEEAGLLEGQEDTLALWIKEHLSVTLFPFQEDIIAALYKQGPDGEVAFVIPRRASGWSSARSVPHC